MPGLGGELKPFQRAGVSYLLAQRRAFLADEQGLGKTIEALATLEADEAYPAIVVCPASLKLNWLRELAPLAAGAQRADARRHGRAASRRRRPTSRSSTTTSSPRASTQLSALAPRALVLDESHYCKNAARQAHSGGAAPRRRGAARRLVLALTGTPVINRPAELISQLRILGRLEDFGSGVKFGERFRGPDAHLRLHWHLRARCFVRRLKADVLPQLPAEDARRRARRARQRVRVPPRRARPHRVASQPAARPARARREGRRRAARRAARAAERAQAARRARQAPRRAAPGSTTSAPPASGSSCSPTTARSSSALLERFPHALHILGKDSHAARDQALRAFQAPDDGAQNQLIVCSIEVAGQGLTLTRASNVAFLELDWTPAKHDQAEDRCHRIGQQDAVNAYYLLAAETVDETIATLLERKRAVIGAVTDGREEDEEGLVDALVRELRGEPYRHLRAVA